MSQLSDTNKSTVLKVLNDEKEENPLYSAPTISFSSCLDQV